MHALVALVALEIELEPRDPPTNRSDTKPWSFDALAVFHNYC